MMSVLFGTQFRFGDIEPTFRTTRVFYHLERYALVPMPKRVKQQLGNRA